jgi:hypothetical protein
MRDWQRSSPLTAVNFGIIAIRPDIHTCPFGCATKTKGRTNRGNAIVTADGYI